MILNALGVHSFAGGFALGMSQNTNVIGQVEATNDNFVGPRLYEFKQMMSDARHNHKWDIIQCDDSSAAYWSNQIDIVFGNPPCAPWSLMNTSSNSWQHDPRLSMVHDVIDTGIRNDSDFILVESVVRSWTKGQEFWRGVADNLASKGYSSYFWLHNVNALGCYQERKRFMYIASKKELTFPDPIPKDERLILSDHFEIMNRVGGSASYTHSVEPEVTADFWAHAQPGPIRKQAFGLDGPNPPFAARKLCMDKPAPTIVGSYLVHPVEPRCLYWGEFRHLLGFPKSWETTRPQTCSADVQAGRLPMTRGVCPIVGEHVSKILVDSNKRVDTPIMRLVDQRS